MNTPKSNKKQGDFISKTRVQKGLTQEMLAQDIGVDIGTVARWERGAQQIRPRNEAAIAFALGVELDQLQHPTVESRPLEIVGDSNRQLRTLDFIAWVATSGRRSFDEIYQEVAKLADDLDKQSHAQRYAKTYAETKITRNELVQVVEDYYNLPCGVRDLYTARIGERQLKLSVLVEPSWINRSVDLNQGGEDSTLVNLGSPELPSISKATADAAIERLASVETSDTVLVNNPMYRLLSFEMTSNRLTTEYSLADFADYALRDGLMEQETINSLRAAEQTEKNQSSATPIRDTLLPDVDAVMNLRTRCCTGGPVSLLAIARPETNQSPADYALFVQVRSGQVMDIPGKLSTIPKGWHQPMGEPASQSTLGATLLRELEEELFGRQDLEQLSDGSKRAAHPMHSQHRPEALRDIVDNPETFRVMNTGFGLNLLSGTFEVPCLIVIDDPEWWNQWGHLISGNWETASIDSYSSMDADGLCALAHDQRWTNEGLFSFIEGLRLLDKLDQTNRVSLPKIEIT